LNGYIEALRLAQLPVPSTLIRYGGLNEEDGYSLLDTMLKQNDVPEAIFCINDPVAIGAYQRINEAGLRIPQDIALVGFSNNRITGLINPPMTTVDQPSFEMGKRAAELLIGAIEAKVAEPSTVVLEGKLVIRASA
jgi:LacI family transcriptional regulator